MMMAPRPAIAIPAGAYFRLFPGSRWQQALAARQAGVIRLARNITKPDPAPIPFNYWAIDQKSLRTGIKNPPADAI